MTNTSNGIGKKIHLAKGMRPRNKQKGTGQRFDFVNDCPQLPRCITLVQNGINDKLGISFNTHLLKTSINCVFLSIPHVQIFFLFPWLLF